MPTEFRFACPLPNGLHARPASLLAAEARRFNARVLIAREPTNGAKTEPVDIRSVLSVVGLDLREGDPCVISASGVDAVAAVAALREFVETRLESLDDTAAADAVTEAPRLPITLRHLDVPHALGRPASAGVGMGVAVVVGAMTLCDAAKSAVPKSAEAERDAARRAVAVVGEDLRRRAAQSRARTERDLLNAHSEIADDPALWSEIERAIAAGATAPQAIVAAADHLASRLRAARSSYIRERVIDVQDICMQLLEHVSDGALGSSQITLEKPSVVFAEILTANQLLRMDRALLRGLVLGAVGETAHTVILARNLGIPCIVSASSAIAQATPGEDAVVDGGAGFVISPITPEVSRFYDREHATHQRRLDRLRPLIGAPARTRDSVRLEVAANASTPEEVAAGMAQGAEGVGLFRTEFIFLEREAPPSEDEQHALYSAAVAGCAGRPIIFRTFDIGGDKSAPYFNIPSEENPFLGLRGLRLYTRHTDLLRAHLRAILRAGADAPPGAVKIMAPMVSTPTEAAWFTDQVRLAEADLAKHNIAVHADTPVGVMIEVPSAAFAVDRIAEHVDFLSIGSNDLCQYWMAADRGNRTVARLCNPLHPSFLRLLRDITTSARDHHTWVGICGEMASHASNIPLMLGLGLDEISVAPSTLLSLKAAIASADSARCRALLDQACACADASEVEALLTTAPWRSPDLDRPPIIDASCIDTSADARSKEEAIKLAVDLLFIAGRTELPRDVEQAVWAREETYSTGLGHAIAVPHCKSDAVLAPTLGVLKLTSPIEWNSMDGEPVTLVLLLAVPESDSTGGGAAAHMKIFATLARKLMHDDFRAALLSAATPSEIEATLRDALQLTGKT